MPSVFTFKTFPDYLTAYLEAARKAQAKQSLRWFARRLGLKSHSYLAAMATGAKAPAPEMLANLIAVLGLGVEEATYLRLLVAMQTAATPEERAFFGNQAASFHTHAAGVRLDLDRFSLIAEWYHLAVFEMTKLKGFDPDPAAIAARLGGAIPPEAAADSLDRLTRLGLIARGPDGAVTRCIEGFTTSHNIPSSAIRGFHRQMLALAARTLDEVPVPERLFFAHTIPLDRARLDEASRLIVEFRQRFEALLAAPDATADRVYHLAIQLFPLTV